MNSVCDQDCWWYYTVIDRTACTVTLQDENGKIIKCRMNSKRNEIWGCEAVRPLGSYSMCPTLTADREMEEENELCEAVRKADVNLDEVTAPVMEDEPKAVIIPLNAQPKAVKSFVIYQLPVEHDATFMGIDFVREHNIMPKLEDYRAIYSGEVEQGATLDDIFMSFNAGKYPDSYVGRSMSVSDVILMDGVYNYCDSFGWEQVNF